MGRYGTTFSARYEDEQEANAVLSAGPASQLCEFPDSDDAPARPASRRIGFGVPQSEEREPKLYEGDQA